jgi:4-diphosphocytidyl-2-C-methyl-D-erythritol kinase
MKSIRIKCPAQINLTLEVVNRREDGFHNINSIMQLISLYDYLDISVTKAESNSIILSGNNPEIPYNEKNLVYKAADLYLKTAELKGYEIKINIEKNIPIAAGLAGGSTDGAGTFLGLNMIFDNKLSKIELHKLCASLGSDLNVCLEGGCLLATSRGENVEKLPFVQMPVTLIKPKALGISAKEAYTKYAAKEFKPKYQNTEKMIEALKKGENIKPYLYNDLEYAVFDDYKELQFIKSKLPQAIMSGSGSTYFVLEDINEDFPAGYQVIKDLIFIQNGCEADM